MDIHHDTSFRFILEDSCISSTFKACIHSCSIKGARLWLIVRPSICLFRITQFIFTSMVRFCFGLIQPLTFNLFMCECGYGLNASSTHLTCCSFRGQWIATHDAIKDVIYAFVQESGHTTWKEWWYALLLGISLQANFYMICENQVFVTNVVVIDLTLGMMATYIIS